MSKFEMKYFDNAILILLILAQIFVCTSTDSSGLLDNFHMQLFWMMVIILMPGVLVAVGVSFWNGQTQFKQFLKNLRIAIPIVICIFLLGYFSGIIFIVSESVT